MRKDKLRTRQKTSLLVSRRAVVLVSTALCALIASVSSIFSLSSCSKKSDGEGQDKPAVIDKSEYDNLLDYIVTDPDLSLKKLISLPLGSVIKLSAERYAAVLEQSKDQMTLSHIGILDVQEGVYKRLIEKPRLAQQGQLNYSLYDVRCSDSLLAWVELNYDTNDWVLFASSFEFGKKLDSVIQLSQGDENMLPPEFEVYKNRVIWQEVPHVDKELKKDPSKLFMWRLGESAGSEFASSPRAFGCRMQVSGSVLSMCARELINDIAYYVIKAFDLEQENKELARLVMPKGVKPSTALYAASKFCITIEASYNFGGLLGHMGSYIGNGNERFLACLREPYAPLTVIGDRYVIKNRNSLLVFDNSDHTYFRLAATNNSTDWGDFCIQVGEASQLISYATVKSLKTGMPEEVQVRIFSLPDDQPHDTQKQGTADEETGEFNYNFSTGGSVSDNPLSRYESQPGAHDVSVLRESASRE